MLIKNKRGAELSMNVIIIAILAILVLVIIAAFFTGGISGLMKLITRTSPDDLATATSICQGDCNLAMTAGTDTEKENSKYCRQTWNLDVDGNGKSDTTVTGDIVDYHCWDYPISVSCGGVREFCTEA